MAVQQVFGETRVENGGIVCEGGRKRIPCGGEHRLHKGADTISGSRITQGNEDGRNGTRRRDANPGGRKRDLGSLIRKGRA